MVAYTASYKERFTTMKPQVFLEAVQQKLSADGAQVTSVQLPSTQAVIGYTSQFRWKWFATKLHLFTVAVYVPDLNAAVYTQLVKEATDYAYANRSKFHGLQVGLATNVIIATRAVDTETTTIASNRPPKGFAKLTSTAVVNLVTAETHTYNGKIVWGSAYTSWLRERLAAALPAFQPRPLTEEDLAEMY